MRLLLLTAAVMLCTLSAGVQANPVHELYLVEKIREAVANSPAGTSWTNCLVCKSTIGIIREFFTKGKAASDLESVLTYGCKFLGIETAAVCEGIIPRFKDMLFTTVAQTTLSAHDLCSLAFNGQCGEPTSEANWTIPETGVKKPPVTPIPPPDSNSARLRIAQFSDTHVDSQYLPGTMVDCADPLCCRESSTPKKNPDVSKGTAGYWGSYANCDVPDRTLEASLQYLAESVEPDYVYWTGDIMPHDVWLNTKEDNVRQFNRTLELLKKYLPNTKVIPALGNHEGVPVNSFPTPQITGDLSVAWLYNSLADLWSYYIPNENLKTFRVGGYFSYDISPKLRVLSLNMNYCNCFNWWVLINTTDPTGQLQWLTNQLQDSENKGIKVHIVAHIPPGHNDCLGVWSRNYNHILNRYESTISGQFYGHTHDDEFSVFFDKDNKTRPFSTAFVAPSITTFGSGSPTFRLYHVDGVHDTSTYQVIDYETHYMDLDLANQHPNDSYVPEWDVIPSIKEHYKMKDLQPQSFVDFIERLKTSNDDFQDFYKMFTKRMPNPAPLTDDKKKSLLCRALTTNTEIPCPL